jgi:hypothetical protein
MAKEKKRIKSGVHVAFTINKPNPIYAATWTSAIMSISQRVKEKKRILSTKRKRAKEEKRGITLEVHSTRHSRFSLVSFFVIPKLDGALECYVTHAQPNVYLDR